MNDSLTCTCPGFTYRLHCRHTTLIAKLVQTGGTFAFPFTVQSSRDPRRTYRVEVVNLDGKPDATARRSPEIALPVPGRDPSAIHRTSKLAEITPCVLTVR